MPTNMAPVRKSMEECAYRKPVMSADVGLSFDDYQSATASSDRGPADSMLVPLLGLFGETGSLLSAVKKRRRDRAADINYRASVIEELGDTLWYLTRLAARAKIELRDIAQNAKTGNSDWSGGAPHGLLFQSFQDGPTVVPLEPTEAFEAMLLALAADVGRVMADYQSGKLANQSDVGTRLVSVFNLLVKAGDAAGVTLEQAATYNLEKIFDRWPRERVYPRLFDEQAETFEQLPRHLAVEVFERTVRGEVYVFQRCNGINLGDRLTDNALTPDDYRFHDVFHYAYAAVLGWSPVLRALMRLKRKSEPLIDEAEDGARANLIEEGIATWIFGQAQKMQLFENMKSGDLSFDLLKSVRQFVTGYEPEKLPLWLWEDAILQGYEVFRFLKKHRRARLILNLSKRRLAVEELPFDS